LAVLIDCGAKIYWMTFAQLKRSLHTFHLKLILVKGTFALYNQFWDVTDESKIVARLNRRQNSLKLFTLVISQNQIILINLKNKSLTHK